MKPEVEIEIEANLSQPPSPPTPPSLSSDSPLPPKTEIDNEEINEK